MPKYVIEREIPGAGRLSKDELKNISQKSCDVLNKLGPRIQWVHSYVTDDTMTGSPPLISRAAWGANEEIVREHARQGGFPANRISWVRAVIDPTTSEG